MSRIIVLDSAPLGLLTQRAGHPQGDACRAWLQSHSDAGAIVVVAEIIDYELRRELLRLGRLKSVQRLDLFNTRPTVRYLPLDTPAIRLAAELWAKVRQQGLPTADRHALDADVILVAQTVNAGFPPADVVVATTNVNHLSRFLPSALWTDI